MSDQIEYVLKKGFEYAAGGEVETAKFISIKPPTAKNLQELAPLKSEVMKAIQWAQSQPQTEDTEVVEVGEGAEGSSSLSPEMVMTTLEVADNVDVVKVLLCVEVMLTKGLGMIDGEVKFSKPKYDELSIPDVYALTGTFIANFIMPSL